MRLVTQGHLDLRAAREQRRDDVTNAGGDARTTCEDGHERTRVMIYGPVATSRIAYRKKGKENLYPQDAELNWGGHSYSQGIVRRNAEAVAVFPFGQAAAQVSAQGAIHLGKRQSEELAVATAADFEDFYAARRPEPCDPGTGLLLTADGSAFAVLPGALRPATAKAAAARAAAAASGGRTIPVTCASPQADGRAGRRRRHPARPPHRRRRPRRPVPPAPPPRRRQPGWRPRSRAEAQGKIMFASVRNPAGEVIADAAAEAHRRDPGRERPWFAVVDGNCHQIETITALARNTRSRSPSSSTSST